MLDLIPAIDIKDGACVRLVQGDLDKNITVYSKDPRDMARHWAELGARRLHVVDLDGARRGRSVNHGVISDIIRDFSGVMEIDLVGGLRDLDTIESYMDAGLAYAVIGTAAIKQPGFLANACDAFPGAIIVSLDARNGNGDTPLHCAARAGTCSILRRSSRRMTRRRSSTRIFPVTACSAE